MSYCKFTSAEDVLLECLDSLRENRRLRAENERLREELGDAREFINKSIAHGEQMNGLLVRAVLDGCISTPSKEANQ